MKIDTRLTEDDLRATILTVLRKVPDGESVRLPTLLRKLTEAVKRALETGERQCEPCLSALISEALTFDRKAQARRVMPLIGPLLDAWEGLSNDTKGYIEAESPVFGEILGKLNRAVEKCRPAQKAFDSNNTRGAIHDA